MSRQRPSLRGRAPALVCLATLATACGGEPRRHATADPSHAGVEDAPSIPAAAAEAPTRPPAAAEPAEVGAGAPELSPSDLAGSPAHSGGGEDERVEAELHGPAAGDRVRACYHYGDWECPTDRCRVKRLALLEQIRSTNEPPEKGSSAFELRRRWESLERHLSGCLRWTLGAKREAAPAEGSVGVVSLDLQFDDCQGRVVRTKVTGVPVQTRKVVEVCLERWTPNRCGGALVEGRPRLPPYAAQYDLEITFGRVVSRCVNY